MAEVITKLKVDNSGYDKKIKDAQRSLDQFGLKGTEVGDKMSGLGRVLTTNLGTLSKWSVGLGAAAGALKVAGDAFKQNEVLMDEWGRVTESTKSVYDGFLNAINTGDIGGFLSNMNNIVSAARAAYDAMDELGTFNAFNQINSEKAKTDLMDALAGYRTGSHTKEQVKAAADEVKKQLSERQRLEQQAYEASINSLAAKRGVDAGMLMQAMSGSYGDYQKLKETEMTGVKINYHSAGQFGGVYTTESKFAATEEEKLGEMLRKLTDEELKNIQALGTAAQRTATEIASVDKQTARVFGQKKVEDSAVRSKKTAKTEKPFWEKDNQFSSSNFGVPMTEISELITQQKILNNALSDPTNFETSEEYQEVAAALADINEQIEMWKQGLAYVCKEAEDVADATQSTDTVSVAKDTGNAWSAAASAVNSIGGALQGLEDPAAKIAGIVGQAIATVTLAFANSLKGAVGPWDYIAAAAAGLATTISTISSIKSVTSGYAEGGLILPNGSPYQGDNIVARLNAGEGVLTAQGIENAGRLASQTNIAGGTMGLRTEISGENLAIILDNNNRRRGRSKSVR